MNPKVRSSITPTERWLAFLLFWHAWASVALTAELTNLSTYELVYVLNDKTPLQVNLELDDANPAERFSLMSTNLSSFTVSDLAQLLTRANAYELRTNDAVYTIVPRSPRLDRVKGLDTQIRFFACTNLNPFIAGHRLSKLLPFDLSCVDPRPPYAFWPNGPEPRFDIPMPEEEWPPYWPQNAVGPVSLQLTNAPGRAILCKLYNTQRKSYWVSTLAPWVSARPGSRELFIYCPDDGMSWSVFFRQDAHFKEFLDEVERMPN